MKLLVANWKMNKTLAESVEFVQTIGEELEKSRNVEAVICPTYLAIPVLDGLLKESRVALGAQDVAPWENGAHTGEVSASMLKHHCEYVIIGHSERRGGLNESMDLVNEKVKRAVEAGLTPIVCVSNEEEVKALATIKGNQSDWVVAFEPLGAIGTGQPSDPEAVVSMVKTIKQQLGKGCRVLYGGSVDVDNIATYVKISDGALIGGASLDPKNFLSLCTIVDA